MTKYIFVTGGVVSSVGKGITTAALGRILKSRNISVVPVVDDHRTRRFLGTLSDRDLKDIGLQRSHAESVPTVNA